MILPLPPFGKVLEAYRNEAIRLEFPLYIFVGDTAKTHAYAHKRIGTLCCYLPIGDNITLYRWPIDGQKVILYDTGGLKGTELKKMSYYLIQNYNPKTLFIFSEDKPFGENHADNIVQCV